MASASTPSERLIYHLGTAVDADQDTVGVNLTREFKNGIYVVSGTLRNSGGRPARLARFTIGLQRLESIWPDDAILRGLRIAYCGAHSRSTLSRSHVMTLDQPTPVTSWWVGAAAPQTGGPGVVIGALDFTRFVSRVTLSRRAMEVVQHLEGWLLEPGEEVEFSPVWIEMTPDAPLEGLERYAAEVGRRHGMPRTAPTSGWGSWGHYLEGIDADLMRENLIALSGSDLLGDVVNVVQIDDGWSELLETDRVSASWRANRRFPSGIAPVASAVQQRGKQCGLWLLPFTVNAGSALAREHPEFLVQNDRGEPFAVGGGASYCLDPTHPGARAWLTDLLSRVRSWGVGYLKLDFLRSLLSPDPDDELDGLSHGRRYHAARTRVEAYRAGLELIRSVVGPDVVLVGCSAPAGPGAGIVDAHRVGPDIEPAWVGRVSGIRDAARSLAANFFWQGRAWHNDPDYLVTARSDAESRFWATAVALSGGSAVVSADTATLDDWQERLFAMVTPPLGVAARPLDLFQAGEDGPRLWHLPLQKGDDAWHLIGLFNWSDGPSEMSLDLRSLGLDGPALLWDVWRERHQTGSGRVPFVVDEHSARLLAIRRAASRPQFVGSDIHYSQGLSGVGAVVWSSTRSTLTIEPGALRRPGRVFVHVPDAWRCLAGADATDSPHIVTARLAPGRTAHIQFGPSPAR